MDTLVEIRDDQWWKKNAFKYKGSYDSIPESENIGDVINVDGSIYVYSETGWIDTSPSEDHQQHMIPKTCTQCGAVLRGSICEYCGTRYDL